jgi:hypothetical protein
MLSAYQSKPIAVARGTADSDKIQSNEPFLIHWLAHKRRFTLTLCRSWRKFALTLCLSVMKFAQTLAGKTFKLLNLPYYLSGRLKEYLDFFYP